MGLHVAFALRFPMTTPKQFWHRGQNRENISYQFRLTLTVGYSTSGGWSVQSLHSLILEICCQISFLLFPLYVLFNPKLVDTGDRIFFQMTNTAVCLVQNDYLLTTVGSKEKFRIRLAVEKRPNGAKGIGETI